MSERALSAPPLAAPGACGEPADAAIQIQEGIVVDANPAWVQRFGAGSELIGQPVMDLFEEACRPALKGALSACLQGRWSGHTLKAGVLRPDRTVVITEVALGLAEYAPYGLCIQLTAPSGRHEPPDERGRIAELEHAVRIDQTTGLLHRPALLQTLRDRLPVALQGGVRCLALVKLEGFTAIEREVGATASEGVLAHFAALLKETLHPSEIAGRFGGVRFLVLLQRGNERDLTAWAQQLVAQAAKRSLRVRDKTVATPCTIGLAIVSPASTDIDSAIAAAVEVYARARQRGGNQALAAWDGGGSGGAHEEIWIKRLKTALLENRFRLVKQPVASLGGGDPRMFDVLLRMVDGQGKEVLPGEFLPAAERNGLLKNIDRWVVAASLSFAAQHRPACLFVRLSKETVQDASFLAWLDGHVRSTRADPQRVCFQVTEAVCVAQPQTRVLAEKLRQWGFRFALESFGSAAGSPLLLESMPLDFVKIDGSLVQSLARDKELQQRVRALTEVAAGHRIRTIAERVEDANTMAVLWQLGIEYIQGYFVNAPEEVVLKADEGTARLRALSETAQVRSLGEPRSR